LVTGQPIQFVLGQLTLAGRAVDDLQLRSPPNSSGSEVVTAATMPPVGA